MEEKPLGIALIVCDQIMTEAINGKNTLVGVFNSLTAPRFPHQHPALCAFVLLSNGRGTMQMELRCSGPEAGNIVARLATVVNFPDPNYVVELKFVFRNLVFPTPGLYSFELLWEDEPLLETRFHLHGVPA